MEQDVRYILTIRARGTFSHKRAKFKVMAMVGALKRLHSGDCAIQGKKM